MEIGAFLIDDQPVMANFFQEGKWLTSYITPEDPGIVTLYDQLTSGVVGIENKIIACWDFVANQIKYKPFVGATIRVEGRVSKQNDYWQSPAMCAATGIGNCANKAFLLTSLIRHGLPAEEVYCVFGNLHNGHIEGHAWVEWTNNHGIDYIVESTRGDVPMVEATPADRYEPIHYFDENSVYAMPGRTLMVPFTANFSTWLKDYLDMRYIDDMRSRG